LLLRVPARPARLPRGVTMRFIQHKAEARWFYRIVSLGYDRWINPLFWTVPMRDTALALARLDDPGLEVVDVGAGTGFATEAIVAVKPRAGEPPALPAPADAAQERAPALAVRLARFAAGSLAGATFIPVALWFTLVRKLRR